MDDNLRHQSAGGRGERAKRVEPPASGGAAPRALSIATALGQLEALIRRGHEIRNTQAVDATRAWQQDCAAAINQLSGGSKAHWLARAYSGAFLVRSGRGAEGAFGPPGAERPERGEGPPRVINGVVVEADATEIVDRILGVLAQGATSLSRMDEVAVASSGAGPRPRQFEFVHHGELRPVLEQAFADGRDALERGEFGLALILTCGVIEAVLTDALDHARAVDHNASASARHESTASYGEASPKPPAGEGGSFETRIAAAERAGLIRGGCARLPPVARKYRDLTDATGELRADAPVSEREARLAGQVLRVVMRDLDPGR